MLCLNIVLSFVALYKMHFGLNTNAYECIFPEHWSILNMHSL